jgi:hypothetical protein
VLVKEISNFEEKFGLKVRNYGWSHETKKFDQIDDIEVFFCNVDERKSFVNVLSEITKVTVK